METTFFVGVDGETIKKTLSEKRGATLVLLRLQILF